MGATSELMLRELRCLARSLATLARERPSRGSEVHRLVESIHEQIHAILESSDRALPAPTLSWLTPRVRQVLCLALRGASRKEIARELGLSVHTVNDHMKSLHLGFEVHSRAELLARWFSRDLEKREYGC